MRQRFDWDGIQPQNPWGDGAGAVAVAVAVAEAEARMRMKDIIELSWLHLVCFHSIVILFFSLASTTKEIVFDFFFPLRFLHSKKVGLFFLF